MKNPYLSANVKDQFYMKWLKEHKTSEMFAVGVLMNVKLGNAVWKGMGKLWRVFIIIQDEHNI